jgi:hypothetical protein
MGTGAFGVSVWTAHNRGITSRAHAQGLARIPQDAPLFGLFAAIGLAAAAGLV